MTTKKNYRNHARGLPRGKPTFPFGANGMRVRHIIRIVDNGGMYECQYAVPSSDNQKHYEFRWDEAGNLGQVSYCNRYGVFESGRFLYWTEDSRMHVAVDDNHYSYYAYDYSGERRIKLTGDNSVLDVNADYMRTISTLENVTLYPSAYMVLTDRGYTKHYYTGMERVAARIGDGGLDVGFYLSNTDSLHARANRLYSQSLAQVNGRVLEANDVDCIMDGEMPVEELGIPFEEIPEQMSATVGTEYGEFFGAMHLVSNAGESPEVYYYHGDHLGSASWITDASGTAVQHLQYLPYGERFVDQRTSGYSERFTFTGKEGDEETGFGYFGARYMDYELMTMWLSVDPMADKYPSISPYVCCNWNPLKLIDPDGEEIGEVVTKYYNFQGELLYETNDGLDDIVLVNNEKSLEADLRNMKNTNTLDSPEANRLLHNKYGTLEYHQKSNSGENNNCISEIWSLYYKQGYADGYNNRNLWKKFFYAIISSFGDDPVDSSPQDIYGGYSGGVEEGSRSRKNGKINLFNPVFKEKQAKIII